MPIQATSGAASYDAFGGGAAAVPQYIEDVFSTWLYTGNGSTQTITNGIDLAGKGGLVWCKERSAGTGGGRDFHYLTDSARGIGYRISTNDTGGNGSLNDTDMASFNSTGFSLNIAADRFNYSGDTYASWTFRKQPKFFDVVTYTGNGSSSRDINHNLASAPGFIIVKRTDSTSDWFCYAENGTVGIDGYSKLNTTAAEVFSANFWGTNSPTSTQFGVSSTINVNGATYVAYLFAHNAGGFGLAGTDNVISCGSFTTDGGGSATVDLGYEPQWLLMRSSSTTDNWYIFDVMRGFSQTSAIALFPNGTSNDYTFTSGTTYPFTPTATGFYTNQTLNGSQDYIYIAIRRGPMKVPTSGTSVFTPDLYTGNSATQTVTSGSPPLDLVWIKGRTASNNPRLYDRLRGATISLAPDTTAAETTRTGGLTAFTQNGFSVGGNGNENESGVSIIAWDFKRAPGFFDVACYTGDNTAGRQINHNLGVSGELIIIKSRSSGGTSWRVWASSINKNMMLELTIAAFTSTSFIRSSDSTTFTVGADGDVNGSSATTYVAYLFATCAGVSKVGSYTGTAATLQIDCGFTGGARFVLIKRTDSTGDWYVWDTARGIVSGNDPYLLLNTSTNEVTSTDYIDTYSAGFEISSTAPAAINASGGSYIFLAIA